MYPKTRMPAPLLLAAGMLVLLLASACSRGELQLAGATMGTTYSVKIVAAPRSLDRTGIARDIEPARQEPSLGADRGWCG